MPVFHVFVYNCVTNIYNLPRSKCGVVQCINKKQFPLYWCFSLFFLTEKSDLTVDALKLHNELQAGPLELSTGAHKDAFMEEELDEAISERTSGTFLSGLSDCSNLTFRKVQRFWESNSAAHKEVHIYTESS